MAMVVVIAPVVDQVARVQIELDFVVQPDQSCQSGRLGVHTRNRQRAERAHSETQHAFHECEPPSVTEFHPAGRQLPAIVLLRCIGGESTTLAYRLRRLQIAPKADRATDESVNNSPSVPIIPHIGFGQDAGL
jgi:hypothetical protein